MGTLKVDIQHLARQVELRSRLRGVLNRIAALYPGRVYQVVIDLANGLDKVNSNTDSTRLPVQPNGFKVLNAERPAYRWKLKVLCLLRVISMAVMYYWLFCGTHDEQDHVSCVHYVKWLENYDPQFFNVYGHINKGWYLADCRKEPVSDEGKPKGSPDVPNFILEGITV